MSTVLGDLLVRYRADISDLQSKVSQAKSDIQSVEESAQNSGGGIFSSFKNAAGGVLEFGQKLGMSIFAIQNLAQGAENLGSALLGPAMQMEQMTTAFTTLDGSASAATQELQKLNEFAAKTPFQTSDIDQAAASLQAFGIKSQDVIPDLTGMGDALSAMGKTSGADLQQIVLAFGHIQTDGHLTGRTMMELGQLGINGMAMLQLATGKSKDELQKMITGGTLPAKQAIADLVAGIEKSNLGGGMAKQAQTAAGQLSTLKSNVNLALAAFGGPILKLAEGGLAQLGALAANPQFQQFAAVLGGGIATGFKVVATVIGGVVTGFMNLANFFKQNEVAALALLIPMGILGAVLTQMAVSAIVGLIAAIPELVAGFVAWTVSAGAAAIATIAATWPLLAIGAVVGLVIGGIILAVQHWGAIMNWFRGVFAAIGAWIGSFFSGVGTVLHNVISGIGSAFSGLGSLIHGIWDGIVNVVKGAINWIIGGIDQFIGFIDSIQIHIPSIGVGPIHTPAFDWNGLGIPKIPFLAEGGFAQGWFIAGERGPELIYSGAGAQVYNNAQTRAMMAGYPISPSVSYAGGGSHTTIVELDGNMLAQITQRNTDRLVRLKLGPHGRAA